MYPAACMVSRCTMSRQCTDKHEAHTLVKEGIEQACKTSFWPTFLSCVARWMYAQDLLTEKHPNQKRQPDHPGGGDHPVFQ